MSGLLVDPDVTPWATGRGRRSAGPTHLRFGRTFEDPSVEDALFPPDGRVLCIASSGDAPRALASTGRTVLAVDLNPFQLDEVRRRLAGCSPRSGRAERALALGRLALAPLGWHPARLRRFCQLDDPDEQARAWRELASPAVRRAFRVGLAPGSIAALLGRPFARLVPADFGDRLLGRIGARVRVAPNRSNPWLALLLTGTWDRPDPPPAGSIELRLGDVATVLEEVPARSLDGISLSNVLDGPGPGYRHRLLRAADRAGRPGAPIVVRSFLDGMDPVASRRAVADHSLLWGSIAVHRAAGSES